MGKYFEIVYVTKDTFVDTMEKVKSILSRMVKDNYGMVILCASDFDTIKLFPEVVDTTGEGIVYKHTNEYTKFLDDFNMQQRFKLVYHEKFKDEEFRKEFETEWNEKFEEETKWEWRQAKI